MLVLVLPLVGAETISVNGDSCDLSESFSLTTGDIPDNVRLNLITKDSAGRYFMGTSNKTNNLSVTLSVFKADSSPTVKDSWQKVGLGNHAGRVDNIAVHPQGYVALANIGLDNGTGNSLYLSLDYGTSWENIIGDAFGKRSIEYVYRSENDATPLAVHRGGIATENRIYELGSAPGGGYTFVTKLDISGAGKLYKIISFSDGNSFIVGENTSGEAEIYKSNGYSLSSWNAVTGIDDPGHAMNVVRAPDNGFLAFVYNSGSSSILVYRSHNGWLWEYSFTISENTSIDLAAHNAGGGYFTKATSALYRATSSGSDAWQKYSELSFSNPGAYRGIIGLDEKTMLVPTTGSENKLYKLVCNSQPIARVAEESVSTQVWAPFTLDASNSSDKEGDSMSFSWSITSTPGETSIGAQNDNTATPTYTVYLEGEYVFTVSVSDNGIPAVEPSTKQVTVLASPSSELTANAGQDKQCNINEECVLSGSASKPMLGDDIAATTWSRVSGPQITWSVSDELTGSFTPTIAGDYNIQLEVVYASGPIAGDWVTITVPEEGAEPAQNQAPVASAGVNQTVFVNTEVELDGSASIDPEGLELEYLWNPVKGTPTLLLEGTANPVFKATETGEYTIRLVVTDAYGATDSDDINIMVIEEDTEQEAVCGNNSCETALGETVESCPADCEVQQPATPTQPATTPGSATAPEGTTSPGTAPKKQPTGPGTTPATGNQAPILTATEQINAIAGEPVSMTSSAVDPEGEEIRFSWSQTRGEKVILSATDTAITEFIPAKTGEYVFEVVATDASNKASEPKTVTVNVSSFLPEAPGRPAPPGNEPAWWAGVAVAAIAVIGGILMYLHKIKKT